MPITDLKGEPPEGFDSAIDLPRSEGERRAWQEANRAWWESHPMRYDFTDAIPLQEFSAPFYEEIDRRFFSETRVFMPWRKIPFDTLIEFDALAKRDVLEIGVGNGSHAQLLVPHARTYTGIDLTDYAVLSTTRRMEVFGLDKAGPRILQMDAEAMTFADSSFDFIWSWGVIHHSADTRRVLREMHRVLRPGGRAVTMVYHRNWWNYYVFAGLFGGIIKGGLLRTGSLHKTRQKEIDGALARFYSIPEWRALVCEMFAVRRVLVFGAKSELVPLPRGSVKRAVLAAIPDTASRFFTNRCRMGTLLVTELEKPR